MSEYLAYLNIISLEDIDQRLFLVSVLTQVDATLLSERYAEQTLKAAK